ncbi:MFS transporter permease [Vibrio parahaemolyticus]|uniref:MFS transporter permease n=1 Tax=Vibrio parahaemolyticus TaxID=670 RepID=UPI0008130EA3|nr:MFS transporter permease [Vibrio parahaemolyticus]EGQ8312583.1 MFS transporter permease [Vibrio parahaemolyticus]EGQ8852956.1 MFS transporter permease [Vibrio parahaemolyticus]EGQ8857604.1 MFS transporter permease [Vibrio parahaemolyticus]EGQ8877095.1 MFS transporter permease [Vibrio parahaemolyticus]EGQ8996291.1 MFS transporter permease [Vibrio parahaemolyticus]
MEKSEYGKWIHAAFTGASFAYFLAVIDKVDLIISSVFLFWATIFFAQALILNSIWAVAHHGFDAEIKSLLNKHSMFRRFSNLSQWLFIIAVIALVLHIVVPVIEVVL